MCCLLTVLLFLGPRVAGILWWIAQPTRWNLAFGSFIWPVLGLIFVPFTTLMYVLLATGPGGVGGFDWLWVGLAVVADIASYGGGGFGNRDRIRGYTSN
jgi:hypothetical protein